MKVPFTLSVESEEIEVLKEFCAKARVPVALVFEGYLTGVVAALRAKGLDKQNNIGKLDFFKLLSGGRLAGL